MNAKYYTDSTYIKELYSLYYVHNGLISHNIPYIAVVELL